MNTGTEQDLSASPPRMRRWTLEFEDDDLEMDYRRDLQRHSARGIRMAILLALTLFTAFGVLDVLLGAERLMLVLGLRSIAVVGTASLYALTFKPVFSLHREAFQLGFCLFMGVMLAGIVIAGGEVIADRYYAGFLLIAIASYLIMGVSFSGATLVAALVFAMFLATEWIFYGGLDVDALSDSAFLVSAIIVAAMGAYLSGKQRRLAYSRGVSLERDRRESRHSALHDALTGLPNRRLFMEKLAQAVARDHRFGMHCAVLFIDLDAFKPINDEHGHAFGDKLLKCAAQKLNDCVRDTDTVARFGGDEFVVLLEDLDEADKANLLVARILESFEKPCHIDGRDIATQISVGCALHPANGETPRELLEFADMAMYGMKRRRGRRTE